MGCSMKKNQLGNVIFTLLILSFLISCNDSINESIGTENLDTEVVNEILGNSENRTNEVVSKVPVEPRGIEVGWQILYEYEFDHYVARSEFGIWPTEYRQHAGSSGDPDRIAKLNELHSKWGFNYIAAHIGVLPNITAIEAAGFPKETNYMALVVVSQAGRDAVANVYNGLSPNDYFWAYYTDEPGTEQNASEFEMFSLDTLVKSIHNYSLFGFGETWLGAFYKFTNTFYKTRPDYIMCTKYFRDELEQDIDQRPRWEEIKNGHYGFTKTWIAAHKDGSEFSQLLGWCKNNNVAPWFYQNEDVHDLSDGMLPQYCNAAWNAGFLDRYDKRFKVWYKCTLTHTHDPLHPGLCNWVEDRRVLEGIFLR